jgi:hypothetical protein
VICSKFVCSKQVFSQFSISSKIFARKKYARKGKIWNARKLQPKFSFKTGNYWELEILHFLITKACIRVNIFELFSFEHFFLRNARKIFSRIGKNEAIFSGSISHKLAKFTFSYNESLYSSKYFRVFFIFHLLNKKCSKIFTRIQTFVIRKCEFGQFLWNWALKYVRM